MLTLNEKVMYGTTGVCTVDSVEEKKIGKVTKRYYVLKPVAQSTSTVFVPEDNEKLLSKVRKVISREEIDEIIDSLSHEPSLWFDDDNERKIKYSEVITSGDRKACLVLIKTLYLRQTELSKVGKRLHLADERALREAQRLIHDEFSVALDIEVSEAAEFVKSKIM